MNFGEAIKTCMSKYVTFSGRAKRSEFWWFYLFTTLVTWGVAIVAGAMFPYDPAMWMTLINLTSLVFFLPILAAGTRRLHDTGKSGWWLLISLTGIGVILLIVWWATDTKSEGDKYDLVNK